MIADPFDVIVHGWMHFSTEWCATCYSALFQARWSLDPVVNDLITSDSNTRKT